MHKLGNRLLKFIN